MWIKCNILERFVMPIREEVLTSHNPWWRDGRVPEKTKGLVRRDIADEINKALSERQIILLRGPHRAGKTTLIH